MLNNLAIVWNKMQRDEKFIASLLLWTVVYFGAQIVRAFL